MCLRHLRTPIDEHAHFQNEMKNKNDDNRLDMLHYRFEIDGFKIENQVVTDETATNHKPKITESVLSTVVSADAFSFTRFAT